MERTFKEIIAVLTWTAFLLLFQNCQGTGFVSKKGEATNPSAEVFAQMGQSLEGAEDSSKESVTDAPSEGSSISEQPQKRQEDYFSSLEISNVLNFGAVGDGATDDSVAFQRAIDASSVLFVPGNKIYRMESALRINKPIKIFSDNTAQLKMVGSASSIYLHSSDIEMTGFKVDASQNNQSCIFHLQNDNVGYWLRDIRISHIEAYNAHCFLKDIYGVQANSFDHTYVGIYINDIVSSHVRGPQISMNGGWAFIFLKNISIPSTSQVFNSPYVSLKNNAGAMIENIKIVGSGQAGQTINHGLHFESSAAIWLTDINIEKVAGYGIYGDSIYGFYLRDTSSRYNGLGGYLVANSQFVQGANVLSQNYVNGVWFSRLGMYLKNSTSVQMQWVDMSGTNGSGLILENVTNSSFSYLQAANNGGYGILSSGNNNVNVWDHNIVGNLTNQTTGVGVNYYTSGQQPLILSFKTPETHLFQNEVAGSFALLNGNFVSVADFGAIGDGVTDDSAAFQKAVDSGVPIYVPYRSGGYRLSHEIRIQNPTQIIGLGKVMLHCESRIPFSIESSNVKMSGFFLKNRSSFGADSVALHLNASNKSIKNIELGELHLESFGYGVSNLSAAANEISHLKVNFLSVLSPKNSSLHLTNIKDSSLNKIFVDQGKVGQIDFKAIVIFQSENVFINESTVVGFGNSGTSLYAQSLFVGQSKDIFINRYMADTVHSDGIGIDSSSRVWLSESVSSLTERVPLLITSSSQVYGLNVLLGGRKGYGSSSFREQANMPGAYFVNSNTAAFANLLTYSLTGSVAEYNNSSAILFQNHIQGH
ncbi:MAG: hypothetical protein KDD33_10365 [Bdellovibrionales bacterium]|nr:hypothetical protein [Bdellovibrionales bacterium]